MVVSFGDPLTLSRFETSQERISSSNFIYASSSKGSKVNYATIGVAGDGIKIIDLSTLQPEAATIFGPGSTFHCTPISRSVQNKDGDPERQTYAVTGTSQPGSEKGENISLWTSSETLSTLEKRSSITIEKSPAELFAPVWMSDTLLAISQEGIMTICDSELNTQWTDKPASRFRSKLISSFLFNTSDFNSANGTNQGSTKTGLLLSIVLLRKNVELRTSIVSSSSVEHIDARKLDVSSEALSSVTCNSDGFLTALGSNGHLFPFTLERHQNGMQVTRLDPIHLHNIHFNSLSILSLTSSHLLVAGITTKDPAIALLLWDTRFLTLLAERRVSIPASLSLASPDEIRLQLVSSSDRQSLLVVNSQLSTTLTDSPSSTKGVIFIIPHNVPATSSLANAIGKAQATNNWLAPAPKPPQLQGVDPEEESREEVLQEIIQALDAGKVEEADRIFFDWEAAEKATVKALAKEEAKKRMELKSDSKAHVNGNATGDDVNMNSDDDVKEKHTEKKVKVKHIRTQVYFGYSFLTRLLEALLPSEIPPGRGYSPKIATYLLERKLITDGMVDGGVLKALQVRKDWESIRWALRNTVDVSEDQLLSLLVETIHVHNSKSPTDEMDIDHSSDKKSSRTLPLSQVLGHVIAYPTSAPPMRVAIRRHLKQAEDVLEVLKIINRWMETRDDKKKDLTLGNVEEKLKYGEELNVEKPLNKNGRPRLDLLVTFLSHVLDAKLVDLLQYRPSHAILHSLYNHTLPEMGYLDSLEKLRGPLEPFVIGDRRNKQFKELSTLHKIQRRHDLNHALNVDQYQIEEFFL
ncbi:hypothetical protein CPB86DRAFT_810725 [Serendipita vermifera]|nr:hypothetical protein CPB86DRAFT_810725 [Serendipita vermifera]